MNTKSRRRRAMRMRGYDYARPGAYYVTACIRKKERLLGDVWRGQVHHSPAGSMVHDFWYAVPQKFPTTELDEFVVMPDHMHAILWLHSLDWALKNGRITVNDVTSANTLVFDDQKMPVAQNGEMADAAEVAGRPRDTGGTHTTVGFSRSTGVALPNGTVLLPSLDRVMQWFKTMTTNAYIEGVRDEGWPSFAGKLWQRSYYDHIIRNDADLDRIRHYIRNNPIRWALRNRR